jgi:hypothetical protein
MQCQEINPEGVELAGREIQPLQGWHDIAVLAADFAGGYSD